MSKRTMSKRTLSARPKSTRPKSRRPKSARPASTRKRAGFKLPDTTDLDSVNAAQVALVRLVAQNRLGAREALYISRMLEHRRRAIGTATLWQQMKELEAQGRQIRGEEP